MNFGRQWGLVIGSVGVLVLASACNQGDDRLAEKARIEGEASAKAELQAQLDNMDKLVEKARAEGKAQAEAELTAQNGNLAAKSVEMEADLATRHRFYQAVKGKYEGKMTTEAGEYTIQITLEPSLPPYSSQRVRQLDEIASDLNNLYLKAQIKQWNPTGRLSGVGCIVSGIRPDLESGEITIAAETCPNLYALQVSAPEQAQREGEAPGKMSAAGVAAGIRSAKIKQVPEIVGMAQPSTNASTYEFAVSRIGVRK